MANETYADENDRASMIEMAANEEAIRAQRAKAAPQQVANPDGTFDITECEECGDEIPLGRLKLGFITCVHCATLKERKGQLYA